MISFCKYATLCLYMNSLYNLVLWALLRRVSELWKEQVSCVRGCGSSNCQLFVLSVWRCRQKEWEENIMMLLRAHLACTPCFLFHSRASSIILLCYSFIFSLSHATLHSLSFLFLSLHRIQMDVLFFLCPFHVDAMILMSTFTF